MLIVGNRRQRSNVADILRRLWPRLSILLGFVAIILITDQALAHERWILSPNQIAELNGQPRPKLYSELSALNVTMISLFLLFILGWVRLGFTGARELFPDLQARLASYGDHVPRILRVCLAWMLLSSAFGLEPRFGVAAFTSPTLFAPDLELRLLGPFEPGDEVIRQGDEGETAYVITSGRVEVLQDGKKLGELGDGDSFGEIALLSKVKRTATVRCLTACELTVLASDDFRALTTGFGSLAEAIRKQAVKF